MVPSRSNDGAAAPRITGWVVRMHLVSGTRASGMEAEFDRVAFDATEAVLALDLEAIHALEDRRESTDALRPEGEDFAPIGGPKGGGTDVIVRESVCEFFGVNDLSEIDAAMLEGARADLGIPGHGPRP